MSFFSRHSFFTVMNFSNNALKTIRHYLVRHSILSIVSLTLLLVLLVIAIYSATASPHLDDTITIPYQSKPSSPLNKTIASEASSPSIAPQHTPVKHESTAKTADSSKPSSQPTASRSTVPSSISTSVPATAPAATPSIVKETPEQLYQRQYRTLHQAAYSVSQSPVRTEADGYIYYTVNLQVSALNDAGFGQPTLFIELVPSTPNRYSCLNPVGTMSTFVYGSNNNATSIVCKVRACPECYSSGGPLPYYGAFTVSVGGLIGNGVPTGVTSRSYDLAPGFDKPT